MLFPLQRNKNTLEISLYFYKTGHCFHVLLHSGIFSCFAMSKIMPDSLATGIAVFIAVFIYIASLLCLKALCKDDVLMLPKGQKLVKILENITLSCKISQCKHNLLQKESGLGFSTKECYTIGDLEHIIALLRAPGGCPWDIEQTHQSVRANLIEETYEAVEAIDTNNMELLKEELGDVLMQVLFHAQMEAEQGTFTFADVVDGVAKKLIVRHPHVFGNVQVTDSSQVLSNWDEIKKKRQNPKQHKQRCLRVFLLHYLPLCAVIRYRKKAAKSWRGCIGRKCSFGPNNCSCAGIKTDIVKTARQ